MSQVSLTIAPPQAAGNNPALVPSSRAADGINPKVLWTVGTFGISVVIKLASNVVLTRLLSPAVFGVMVVVTSIRIGAELLTDVGIEQNIVKSPHGLGDAFFNTAWTMQILRGALLTTLFLAVSPALSNWYNFDRSVFFTISFAPFLNSLHSTSIFAASKGLNVKRRVLFEATCELITLVLCVGFALVTPTVWALLFGTLLSIAARSALSYLLPHPDHRFFIDKAKALEIFNFGKWIALASLVVYGSTNLDRVYLGRHLPLAMLGIYGLARTIADLPPLLASRISYHVLFPLVSANAGNIDASFFDSMRSVRRRLVLIGAIGISISIASADIAVRIVYDVRYADAGWMLSLLLVGAWWSMMASLNEAVLLGTDRATSFSLANVARFVTLAIGLPLLWLAFGMPGAILGLVTSEFARYVTVTFCLRAMRSRLLYQDVAATVVMFALLAAWIALRLSLSLGTPWGRLFVDRLHG